MMNNKLFRPFLYVVMLVTLMAAYSAVSAQDATPEVTPEPTEEAATQTSGDALPDRVVVSSEGLFPEGVEYDTLNQRFLVSSTADGMVRTVADDGTLEVLVADDRLPPSIGIEADEASNRLLVAATDMKMKGFLGIYDLTTGENIHLVDFRPLTPTDPEHFINDVAVDSQGNAYVTDSYAGVIFRVDPQGNASIFLEDESFSTQFTLNGIVYHEVGNFLIAVQMPYLIKIPLENPAAFTRINVAQLFPGADGLVLLNESTLVVVTNNPAKVFRLETEDAFASAVVTGIFETGNVNPTTAAVRDGEAYVLYAQLNAEEQTITDFPIQRVMFEAPPAAEEPVAEAPETEPTPEVTP